MTLADRLNQLADETVVPRLAEPSDIIRAGDRLRARRRRRTVLTTATAALLAVAALASLPRFDQRAAPPPPAHRGDHAALASPWPGAQRVQTAFEPAASYSLPRGHVAAQDHPALTYWRFPGTRVSGVEIYVSRIVSYQGRRHHSVGAYLRELRRDERMRVRDVRQTKVDGEPAVRVTTRARLGQPLTQSFCLPPDAPVHCWDVAEATVSTTAYIVRRDGQVVLIESVGHNLRVSRRAARVLDSVVASWRWTGP